MPLPTHNRKVIYWTLGLVAVGFLAANRAMREVFSRRREIQRFRAEVVELKKENEILKRDLYYLENNPRALESLARRDLGMIRPGETLYRFIPKEKSP